MVTASVLHGRHTNTARLSLVFQEEGSAGLQPPLACLYIRSFVCARGRKKKKTVQMSGSWVSEKLTGELSWASLL